MALGCEESLWTHWILLSSVQGRSVLFLFYHCSFPAITIVFIKEWWTFIRILLHSEKNSSFLFLRWSSDNHPPPHHPLVMWPRAHSVNSSVLKRSEKVTASPLIVKLPALQTPPTAGSSHCQVTDELWTNTRDRARDPKPVNPRMDDFEEPLLYAAMEMCN